jgi:nucleoside-diphosphate kinase
MERIFQVSSQTLAILKPDCIQNKNTGKVIDLLLSKGFNVKAMKMVKLTKETAGEFYAIHKERPFYQELVNFMTESHVIAMVLEKEKAVSSLREVIGATDPAEAKEGTVRRLFAENKSRNSIHASDSNENAIREILFFFSESEIIANN